MYLKKGPLEVGDHIFFSRNIRLFSVGMEKTYPGIVRTRDLTCSAYFPPLNVPSLTEKFGMLKAIS